MFKIKNEFKGANVPRTIRFTEKMFEQLNQLAVQNDISFNLLILQCCQYALDNFDNSDDSKNNNRVVLKPNIADKEQIFVDTKT